MPFVDVSVKTGTVAPMQIDRESPKLNEGVMIGLTVTASVSLSMHCCGVAVGVNIYEPEF